MIDNEKITPIPNETFNKVIAIIVAQHNDSGVNFSFHFNLDEENSKLLIASLYEYLTKIMAIENAKTSSTH